MNTVSIIVPVYRVEKYIAACIQSILGQKYPCIELIIVNDCTDDSSIEIAHFILDELPHDSLFRVVWVGHERNRGVSAARNTGILSASGEYIFFLDADDVIPSDCIADLVEAAELSESQMVVGENLIISGEKERYIKIGVQDHTIKGNASILNDYLNGKWYNVAWNKLIKRCFILDNSLFFAEGLLFEDELWGFMLASVLESIAVIRKPTYHYIQHNGSIMHSIENKKRNKLMIPVLRLMRQYIIEAGLDCNYSVLRFYLLKVQSIAYQLNKGKDLNYPLFKDIRNLFYSTNICGLRSMNLLSRNESIAYYWIAIRNDIISYMYFRSIMALL